MIFLIKLLLAHMIGDFLFQSKNWVLAKEKKKGKSWQLYVHSIIHGVLALLFVWEFWFWPYALFIAITHFHIDWLKLNFQKEESRLRWFFIDQVLHLSVIFGLFLFLEGPIDFSFNEISLHVFWLITLGLAFISLASPIVISIILQSLANEIAEDQNNSLGNAGKIIGVLERVLVFVFIISDNWEGVGFLIAAKSIFRFGDLKEAKDRKLTEYILIGTLLSFGIAILVGILIQYLIEIYS
jgi:hypothetical protein